MKRIFVRVITNKNFKRSVFLTLYVLKLSWCIFSIPILISTAVCIWNSYIGAILICGTILSTFPITYKIIIPCMEKRRQEIYDSK